MKRKKRRLLNKAIDLSVRIERLRSVVLEQRKVLDIIEAGYIVSVTPEQWKRLTSTESIDE